MLTFLRRLLVLGLTASGICGAEDLCGLPTKARGLGPPKSNLDAYTVLDSIGRVVPFQTRTIQVFPSSDSLVRERGGAAAQLCGIGSTERWIFYDPTYVDSIVKSGRGKNDPRYFILAHEAAHHINGDTLQGGRWSKDQELAADYSAAVWLTRLGVRRVELLITFDSLGFPVESINGYPTNSERREKLIQGYEESQLPDRWTDRWIDQYTGLMWAKHGSGTLFTQPTARKYCADLRIGGFADWRLPDIDELGTIFISPHYRAEGGAYIEGGITLNNNHYAWSSSLEYDSTQALAKDFEQELTYRKGFSYGLDVIVADTLCVRRAQ